jgi:hypothetical protein
MEGIVGPMEWEDIPAVAQPRFRAVRSHEGEELVLMHNIFIEQSLVRGTLRSMPTLRSLNIGVHFWSRERIDGPGSLGPANCRLEASLRMWLEL